MVKLRKKAGVARRVRRQHTGAFKAQVALAALREDKTMVQLCQEFDLHPQPNQRVEAPTAGTRRRRFRWCRSTQTGGPATAARQDRTSRLENDFLERALKGLWGPFLRMGKAGLLSAR